jgi:pimeloyl-ACP methyl ester carboxylesterase
MKFRVAPAVIKRGRVMAEKWFCVPNHCNVFPEGIPEALGAVRIFWNGSGDIKSDGRVLLEQLPNEPVVLVGYSYGGLVAWWVSLVAKERVIRLILIGTIPHRRHIPLRLRLLLSVVPSHFLLLWRNKMALSRLNSIRLDVPISPPCTHTLWVLGKNDPFHKWKKSMLPKWSEVEFYLHDGGAVLSHEEWGRLKKFS